MMLSLLHTDVLCPSCSYLEGPDGEYRYVGDVYVDGLMYGKALDMLAGGLVEERVFVIHCEI